MLWGTVETAEEDLVQDRVASVHILSTVLYKGQAHKGTVSR